MRAVRRGGDAEVRWEAVAARPAAALGGLVSRYGGFQERSARPVMRRELGSPDLVLVLSLTHPLTVTRGADSRAGTGPAAVLVGVGTAAVTAAHGGTQTVLEAQLSPLAALRLFGVPASELADRVVDLVDLWGAGGAELVERAAEARTWQQRVDLLDAALVAGAEHGPPVDPVLAGGWQHMRDRRGDLAIHELHERTAWSRRRLARRFREQVGLPPKAMARLLRFQHAVGLVRRPGHRSLAAIAVTCGYYDQAHLNRDFRALAGCTPTAYLAAWQADAAGSGMAGD